MGEEGLECRRAEARRSVDCPRGNPRGKHAPESNRTAADWMTALRDPHTRRDTVSELPRCYEKHHSTRALTIEILTLAIAAPR